MFRLAELLQTDGHTVKVASGDTHNFLNNKSISNYYDQVSFDGWITLEEQYHNLYYKGWAVDWQYLTEFEREHCQSKSLEQLLMTDPGLSRHHHHRNPYYTPLDDDLLRYYWGELMIRWLSGIFDRFDPDVIFMYQNNYFIKNVAAQLAMSQDRHLLSVMHSRVGDLNLLSRQFGLGADLDAKAYIMGHKRAKNLDKARDVIDAFREAGAYAALYNARSQEGMGDGALFTTSEVVRWYVQGLWGQILRRIILRRKRKFRGTLRGNHFDSHTPSIIRFHTRVAINKLRYLFSTPFVSRLPSRPFIYYPLHVLPESSTLTRSTEYFEEDLIRFISKELPAGWLLAVKENPNMVGIRPYSVYEELERIPNVALIDPTVPSKRLIEQSEGVCGVSGTALLEAALLGQPTHAFGQPEFLDVIGSTGHDAFPGFVDRCRDGAPDDNPDRATRYLQYVLDHGWEFDLYKVRNKQHTAEFEDGIDMVYDMVTSAIEEGPRMPPGPSA